MKKILKEFKIIGHSFDNPDLKLFLVGYMEEPTGVYTLVTVAKREDLVNPDKAIILESLLEDSIGEWTLTKPYSQK